MKRAILAAVLALTTVTATAAGIDGRWQTYSDKDGKPKVVIAIGGSSGRVVSVAPGVDPNCPSCKTPGKLVGRSILTGVRPTEKPNEYEGKIFDPQNGKTYSMYATLSGSSLKVCGYIGARFIGRCQTWRRV